jgi:AbrB family looped-hinge helix DNA binding protein
MTATTTLSSKGQVVIPKILRERLGLHPGSELLIRLKGKDVLEFKPIQRHISEMFGKGAPYVADQPPMSVEDMDSAIAQAVMKNNDEDK